jgi:uncharacterized membrane protein YoaK (UPF0700 family)
MEDSFNPIPRFLLPAVLSMIAGAVDVVTFLALGGLFSAHITGNLVILAAHYITGHFGQIGPLLSVPVFAGIVNIVALVFVRIPTPIARRSMLILQLVLLGALLCFAVVFGPFPNPDSTIAVFTGMLAVAAMATQNALVNLALPDSPSTAVMTTNTARFAVNLARLLRGERRLSNRSAVEQRTGITFVAMVGFVIGVIAGAVLELHVGLWALTFPVLLGAVAIPLGERWPTASPLIRPS